MMSVEDGSCADGCMRLLFWIGLVFLPFSSFVFPYSYGGLFAHFSLSTLQFHFLLYHSACARPLNVYWHSWG